MPFNSVHYLFFLSVVCGVFYLLQSRMKLYWLIAASYFFYMSWNPWYAIFLVFITLNDFYCARYIQQSQDRKMANLLAIISIGANVSLLVFFKFLDTINAAVLALSKGEFSFGNLVIPLGISYHTFQSISYIIDVKKGRIPASNNLGQFAWFIVFFPQLVAGPIERASSMFPQAAALRNPELNVVNGGLKMFTWGLFKKAVIADRIALMIDPVFDNPGIFPGWSLIFVLFAFTLQIYFDFSGYVDMARGSARLFGVILSLNFNHPLSSVSLREFWRNWHISLSSWLRDYIYIPLGGRFRKVYRNLFLTFLISGIWHGTGWNFLIFGLFHGALFCFEYRFDALRENTHKKSFHWNVIPRFIVFHSVLALGWLLFRNTDITHVIRYTVCVFSQPFAGSLVSSVPREAFIGCVIALFVIVTEDVFIPKLQSNPRFSFPLRAMLYVSLVLSIIFFGVFTQRDFIYFQF